MILLIIKTIRIYIGETRRNATVVVVVVVVVAVAVVAVAVAVAVVVVVLAKSTVFTYQITFGETTVI